MTKSIEALQKKLQEAQQPLCLGNCCEVEIIDGNIVLYKTGKRHKEKRRIVLDWDGWLFLRDYIDNQSAIRKSIYKLRRKGK